MTTSERRRVAGCQALEELRSIMASRSLKGDLRAAIRNIPDYPKPGIVFRDITTLLGDARAFRRAVDELVQPWAGMKKGKLPYKRVTIGYSLEYGIDEMEMHEDAVRKGERVILVDDLIATGGTAEGAVKLLRQLGADILAACFVIDLPALGGADKLRKMDVPVRTLISFEGH